MKHQTAEGLDYWGTALCKVSSSSPVLLADRGAAAPSSAMGSEIRGLKGYLSAE